MRHGYFGWEFVSKMQTGGDKKKVCSCFRRLEMDTKSIAGPKSNDR